MSFNAQECSSESPCLRVQWNTVPNDPHPWSVTHYLSTYFSFAFDIVALLAEIRPEDCALPTSEASRGLL